MQGANKTEESDVPLTDQAEESEEKDPHSLIASPISDCEEKPNKAFTGERDNNSTHKKIKYSSITPAMPQSSLEANGFDENKFLTHSNSKASHCDRPTPLVDTTSLSRPQHGNKQWQTKRITATFIEMSQLRNMELMTKTKHVNLRKLFVLNENCFVTVHEPSKCEIGYIQVIESHENLFGPLQSIPDVSWNVSRYEFKALNAVAATKRSPIEGLSRMIYFLETCLLEDFCRIKGMALAKIRVKHVDNTSFEIPISCNGFITGGKIASNNVMICLVIVTNLIFETKRNSTVYDVELTFDIRGDLDRSWKNEQHVEGKQLQQFSLSGDNFQPCSRSKETEIVSFSERPLIYLEAPGPRNYSSRLF